jgi:dolichol-phosphate mannosyltransferase
MDPMGFWDERLGATMDRSGQIEVSAVVPVFNEEENLPILIPKLAEVLGGLGVTYEMVFVDDASSDGSRGILKEMALRRPFMHLIRFRENRGLSTALYVGIKEARGQTIVTLDADLQNDPEDIPKLMAYLDTYDMATGWRQKREDPWLKRISSKIANRIRNRISGEEIKDSACTLRVFKKKCVSGITPFNGMHRFLSTLVKTEGYRIIEVPVAHHRRKFGTSKYNIRNRMVRSFVDLLGVRWLKNRRIRYDVEERV